jgi:hypothetical protein
MSEKRDWEKRAAGLIKAELKLRAMTYNDLRDHLAAIGVDEKEANIRNKLNRGTFSAAFFLQCLAALNVETLRL